MKKVVVGESGAADVLNVVDAEPPKPKAGEVVIEVETAGVNYLDVYQRSGSVKMPTPFVPGFEGVGHVLEVGKGVIESGQTCRMDQFAGLLRRTDRVADRASGRYSGVLSTFGLHDVVAAHRAIESRSTQGKLALIP